MNLIARNMTNSFRKICDTIEKVILFFVVGSYFQNQFESNFRNTIRLPNSLDPDQDKRDVQWLFTKGNQKTTSVAIEIMVVFLITRHA